MPPLPDTATIEHGRLAIGGVDAGELAERFGTPLYVYDEQTLRNRARAYLAGLEAYPGRSRAAFACKAQHTVAVLSVLREEGLGADVASAGELAFALSAGIAGEQVIVHGNNKSDADLDAAVAAGAGLVVVDAPDEAARVDAVAAAQGRVQRILVRITPGIEAGGHRKIATGHHGSKFGLDPAQALEALELAGQLAHVHPAGLHLHLGSQIDQLSPYLEAVAWLVEFLDDQGLAELEVLDLGGGLAVAHTDEDPRLDPQTAVETICEALTDGLIGHGLELPELIIEPGRSIAGPAGVTLYTVGEIKRSGDGTHYAAIDGGMSDNPRPSLYGARYEALVVDRADALAAGEYAIAGKHCESGDVLIERAALPELRRGDVLAVPATGAYTATMASTYNAVPRPAAVLVAGGEARLVVERETIADLLARER
ncbi:MAG TPA: diaminopimelate decarboxylase [Thermoleophilia bacterium]|nr:diaminopimelate decarboxylase [Thermoleophilia bacterium]